MRTYLSALWDSVRTGYWFIPTLMSFASVGLALLTLYFDEKTKEDWILQVGWFWVGSPEGARTLLSTIAGSIITVAGVVFSITITTLTLASSQYGPRIMQNFMRDTVNQTVLGTFIATFVYCLLVMRAVRSIRDIDFLPNISITVGIGLALLSLGVLIYFIHHVSDSIHVENLIANVARELENVIERIYPEELGRDIAGEPIRQTQEILPEALRESVSFKVYSKESGYIQAVETDRLMRIIVAHDLTIRLNHRPGDFLAKGEMFAEAWPEYRCSEKLSASIMNSIVVGRHRTSLQDVEYSLRQLVEIALRALSPGINDPFTATSCLDWISAALIQLAGRKFPSHYRYDERLRLRIITHRTTFEGLLDLAFNQVRQAAEGHISVLIHMLATIKRVLERAHFRPYHEIFLRHAKLVRDTALGMTLNDYDRDAVESRYQDIIRLIHAGSLPG